MSRSAIGMWKDSYASAADELPPLPEDMTIPQFVSLCFDRICYVSTLPSSPLCATNTRAHPVLPRTQRYQHILDRSQTDMQEMHAERVSEDLAIV